MREGWGITHDYVKDEENLWRLYNALSKGEQNLDNLFKPGKFFCNKSSVIFDRWK